MKVLADFHHGSLFYSFHLLFEKRFGWELYHPIGLEWFENGFWSIAEPYGNNMDTVRQFLQITPEYQPADGTVPLNTVISEKSTDFYRIYDHAHDYKRKAMTFHQFCRQRFDIVISSIPRHWETWGGLRKHALYKQFAHVNHMGNMFDEVHQYMKEGIVENLLASTSRFPVPESVNEVFYHQEIDLNAFSFAPPQKTNKITSFVNLLPAHEKYREAEARLHEFEFRAYGASTPDGVIHTITDMAKEMKKAMFAWHVKPHGDGFGHVLYDWALTGRPIITDFSDYRGKLGEELLVDKQTAINIENRGMEEVAELVRKYSDSGWYKEMAVNMNNRVWQVLKYKDEEKEIRKFLGIAIMSSIAKK